MGVCLCASTRPQSRLCFECTYARRSHALFCVRHSLIHHLVSSHGDESNTELWNYGQDVQRVIVDSAINLRYRFLPYNYAGFHRVSLVGSAEDDGSTAPFTTMQRALVFDFASDATTHSMADEFMWGPSVLVAPFTTPMNTTTGLSERDVYLPNTAGGWTDFYSGVAVAGGAWIKATAPANRTLVYVKAGAIIPLGPYVQWAAEKAADPLEVRVYPGADGTFTLYEDDGVTAAPAPHSTIVFSWDDAAEQLTIGARNGSFPGMLGTRTMLVVRVRPGTDGNGVAPVQSPTATVTYSGGFTVVDLSP